jgi:hypothetical protein
MARMAIKPHTELKGIELQEIGIIQFLFQLSNFISLKMAPLQSRVPFVLGHPVRIKL